MGGASSRNDVYSETDNYVDNSVKNTCAITCQNIAQGNNINISGGTFDGDLNVLTQECTVDANCVFNSTVDTMADLLAKTDVNTQTTPAGVLQSVSTQNNMKTIQKSQITNNIQQECKVSGGNTASDISINITGATVKGTANLIAQKANVKGSCDLSSALKTVSNMTNTSSLVSKTGKDKCGDLPKMLVIAITIIALAGIAGGIWYASKHYGENSNEESS